LIGRTPVFTLLGRILTSSSANTFAIVFSGIAVAGVRTVDFPTFRRQTIALATVKAIIILTAAPKTTLGRSRLTISFFPQASPQNLAGVFICYSLGPIVITAIFNTFSIGTAISAALARRILATAIRAGAVVISRVAFAFFSRTGYAHASAVAIALSAINAIIVLFCRVVPFATLGGAGLTIFSANRASP